MSESMRKGIITPTWPNSNRGFGRRVQWGLLVGAADMFSGAVSIVTLGQFASWLPLKVSFRLAIEESRRAQEEARDDA